LRNIAQYFAQFHWLLRNVARLLRNAACVMLRNCQTFRLRSILRNIAIICCALLRNLRNLIPSPINFPQVLRRRYTHLSLWKNKCCHIMMKFATRRRNWRCASVLDHVALCQWRFCFSFSQMHARYDFCDLCARVLRDVQFKNVFPPSRARIDSDRQELVLVPAPSSFRQMSGKHEGTPSVKFPTTVLLVVLWCVHGVDGCHPKFSSNVALVRRAVAQYCETFRETCDCALLRWFSHTF